MNHYCPKCMSYNLKEFGLNIICSDCGEVINHDDVEAIFEAEEENIPFQIGIAGFGLPALIIGVEAPCLGCKAARNGTDPMSDTQLGITCTLFSYLYGKCIQGDTVNFDNESFRKMCEYVKNNVPEKSQYNYDFDGNATYEGLYYFLERHTYNSTKNTLLGYPTPDGCGPYITVDTSVGISAFAPSSVVDGAWEFIKTCLGEEVQALIAEGDTNPINKNVYDSCAGKALEKYNKSDVSFGIPMDESVITSYKKVLESASVIVSDDPAVMNIIREEIPAYYLDQKSLDAVISIINNRVTTVIAERTTNVKNAK